MQYLLLVVFTILLSACGKKMDVEPLKPGPFPRSYPQQEEVSP